MDVNGHERYKWLPTEIFPADSLCRKLIESSQPQLYKSLLGWYIDTMLRWYHRTKA